MILLSKAILEGWPESRDVLQMEIRNYWNWRDDFPVEMNWSTSQVIAHTYRLEMLKSHLDIVKSFKCKPMTRKVMFWSSMGSHNEDDISKLLISDRT